MELLNLRVQKILKKWLSGMMISFIRFYLSKKRGLNCPITRAYFAASSEVIVALELQTPMKV